MSKLFYHEGNILTVVAQPHSIFLRCNWAPLVVTFQIISNVLPQWILDAQNKTFDNGLSGKRKEYTALISQQWRKPKQISGFDSENYDVHRMT